MKRNAPAGQYDPLEGERSRTVPPNNLYTLISLLSPLYAKVSKSIILVVMYTLKNSILDMHVNFNDTYVKCGY